MKKYSSEAKDLLTTMELHEIKAGKAADNGPLDLVSCGLFCTSCLGCTSCTACTSSMADVFAAP